MSDSCTGAKLWITSPKLNKQWKLSKNRHLERFFGTKCLIAQMKKHSAVAGQPIVCISLRNPFFYKLSGHISWKSNGFSEHEPNRSQWASKLLFNLLVIFLAAEYKARTNTHQCENTHWAHELLFRKYQTQVARIVLLTQTIITIIITITVLRELQRIKLPFQSNVIHIPWLTAKLNEFWRICSE